MLIISWLEKQIYTNTEACFPRLGICVLVWSHDEISSQLNLQLWGRVSGHSPGPCCEVRLACSLGLWAHLQLNMGLAGAVPLWVRITCISHFLLRCDLKSKWRRQHSGEMDTDSCWVVLTACSLMSLQRLGRTLTCCFRSCPRHLPLVSLILTFFPLII